MYIGVYLCLSGIFYLFGLIWLARPSRRVLIYTGLAWLLAIVGLVVFEGFSALTGIAPFGEANSFSYPGDYLARGPLGWALMLVLPLGFLSPLLLAVWTARRRGDAETS